MSSEHQLARAIINKAVQEGLHLSEPSDFISFPGKGVKARLGTEWGYVGSLSFFSEQGLPVDVFKPLVERLTRQARTALLVQRGTVQGVISLSDSLRKEAAPCIKALTACGIEHIALISGDHERVVAELADNLGIKEYYAGMLPDQKVAVVQSMVARYGTAAMVGDGVNDAPALASSTVGIAMGVAGTDTALETADIGLMSDDLLKLPFLISLSRRTLDTIKANIGFSILVKAVFICLVFSGAANLWMAVAADTGTSLLVTLNGMRLIGFKNRGFTGSC
jgi:Cd2+/Zn2+-exporting ATPase